MFEGAPNAEDPGTAMRRSQEPLKSRQLERTLSAGVDDMAGVFCQS
jgi:hypothetical protein